MEAFTFEDAVRPTPLSGTERNRRYRDSGHKRDYRHNNSKWETDAHYLSRPVVVWDGEGITDPETGVHHYVMLAAKSDDNSFDDDLAITRGQKQLGTAQIFDFLLEGAAAAPDAIHCIYGGGYDANMWIRDFHRHEVARLVRCKFMTWQNYRLSWRQGKSFYICKVDADGKKIGEGVTIYDVVSFFQCSFVKACDDYLGDKFYQRDMIVENKALRSVFRVEDIPDVRRYNDAELVNLIQLIKELRSRLNKVGLRPRRWDGPGAVASALLLREGVKECMKVSSPEIAEASAYAYSGGRFEVIRFGHVENRKSYEYDINSAYPSALRYVPDLSSGWWEHIDGDPGDQPFAIYHTSYKCYDEALPGALWFRDRKGNVSFPLCGTGWYWSPEIAVARKYPNGEITVFEAWVFHPTSDRLPFDFIEPMFNKRRALKKAGDGAHVGIKLALNSLYGKTCQQIGWEPALFKDGVEIKPVRIPPFHQLEWAGYTTSWCRARILEACISNLSAIIAVETDAVFSSEPLDLKIGTALGEWEMTEFTSLSYFSSGVYFATSLDGDKTNKTRGVDLGNMSREAAVEKFFSAWRARDREIRVEGITRFIGAKVALAQGWARWCRWEKQNKVVALQPQSKREHLVHAGRQCPHDHIHHNMRDESMGYMHLKTCRKKKCKNCANICEYYDNWFPGKLAELDAQPALKRNEWHETYCGMFYSKVSHSNPHLIAWHPTPDGMELAEELIAEQKLERSYDYLD